MSRRTQLLIKEIARLFVDYRTRDWDPVLSQLRMGGTSHRDIADAVQDILSIVEAAGKRTPKAKRAKATRKRPQLRPQARAPVSEERLPLLDPLREALLAKAILPTAKSLREAYLRIGIKERMPADRGAAIDGLIYHLDHLPAERFSKTLEAIADSSSVRQANLEEDYKRWFAIITKDASAPADKQ